MFLTIEYLQVPYLLRAAGSQDGYIAEALTRAWNTEEISSLGGGVPFGVQVKKTPVGTPPNV
jgi:hypothetical protein